MQQEGNTLDSNEEPEFKKWMGEAKSYPGLKEYFADINSAGISYVVMRNWENLPGSAELGEHSDLDLLVDSSDLAKFFHTTLPIHRSRQAIINQVIQPVGESYVKVDVRTSRDNYLPPRLADEILSTRVLSKVNECYIPGNTDLLFYSLVYHAAFQKPKISDEYVEKLLKISPEDFDKAKIKDRDYVKEYLTKKNYDLVEPYDPYVFWVYRKVNEKYPGVVVT